MRADVVLLHPPAVFDFRERPRLWGPLADVVPSSSVFEMYPVGETSLLERLERAGYRVALVNVANRMLADEGYDVDAHLRRLQAPVFGIDLHWLPHAQGAIELARRVKEAHPASWVVLGGLTATWFHREILERYPWIDAVLRGDSTEEPMLRLVRALLEGRGALAEVPNLSYRLARPARKPSAGAEIRVNPLVHVPGSLDGLRLPAYDAVVRAALRQRSIADVEPYHGWRNYPTTMLLTLRGCTQSCILCGGSRQAYRRLCARTAPAFRSAEDLAADVASIARISRHPIFVVGDPRLGGRARWERLLALWRRLPPRNELVFELFGPADERFFAGLAEAVPRWSLELSIESQDPALRALNRKFACPDAAVEATVRAALAHGARKVDLFFMTGLAGQDRESALAIVPYARRLAEASGGDRRFEPFVAPLGPFLDPGSTVWTDPDRYGYRLFYRTLEEHRRALSQRTWRQLLGYETRWLSRAAIVDATYEVALGLNELKRAYGATSEEAAERVRRTAGRERLLLDRLEGEQAHHPGEAAPFPAGLPGGGSLCDPAELTWPA
ncbi:MAG: TIGR04190 family B12-binding domain/radical SAM domain protein [Clostridia bacterium]|nr:TIGR04190 family B12-binding domain/radical SAM domain protein [Clostridia bacterium]MCL6522149.1 TIGR04190 family B12-binding domain/radical SAM domain protein [Bacillota bacterium]